MSWKPRRLNELGLVSRGRSRHRPRDAAHLYGGPYPFIQTGDVKHAALYVTEHGQTYSEAGLDQSRLWPAGTLCITIAANIADTAILTYDACFPDSVIGFVPDADKADARFIKYYFDVHLKGKYRQFSQGAAQDNLSQEKLLSLELTVPDVDEQRRIADRIACYDDLIENNRRRIALLEQSARLLYREWFVHLRFPGHEHVKVVDGAPEGWATKAVAEMADLYRGISYSSDQLVSDDGKPFVNLKCMDRLGGFRASGLKTFKGQHKAHHAVAAGDIVCAVTDMTRDALIVAQAARVPRVVDEDAVFSMDMVKLVPKPAFSAEWFYALLRFSSFSFEVREKATGATVLHLRPKHIEEWRTAVPPEALRKEFAEYAEPWLELMDCLEVQNEKLRQARDLLLPRLMSGQIQLNKSSYA